MLCISQSPVQRAFKNGSVPKLAKKSKYHVDIINELIGTSHVDQFIDIVFTIIKVGPLSANLVNNMNQVFSGRWIEDDKKPLYHEPLKECGEILAEFGTLRSCYLAIQLANIVGHNVYPTELKEKFTNAILEDTPKCDEDRWIFRIVQAYFIC